jgi:hypothetical protein
VEKIAFLRKTIIVVCLFFRLATGCFSANNPFEIIQTFEKIRPITVGQKQAIETSQFSQKCKIFSQIVVSVLFPLLKKKLRRDCVSKV